MKRRRGWGAWFSCEVVSHFYHVREALLLSPSHCLILQVFTSDSGTMFCWLFTWPLYLFGLVTSTDIDKPPMDLTDEPGARMLHKGESYFASNERVPLFTFWSCKAYKPSSDSTRQSLILTNEVSLKII